MEPSKDLSSSLGKTTRSKSLSSETSVVLLQPLPTPSKPTPEVVVVPEKKQPPLKKEGKKTNNPPSNQQQQQQKKSNAISAGLPLNHGTDKRRTPTDFFAHLETGELCPNARLIHPSVIRLGLRYASYEIKGASSRCRHLLEAFKDVREGSIVINHILIMSFQVIRDYKSSQNEAICRHLESYINPQIAYLVSARPLGVSMGHAIRGLKLAISTLPPDLPEADAKEALYRYIDQYRQNRLVGADQLIVERGLAKIYEGDTVLTMGRSEVVRDLLVAAHRRGTAFRVIVVGGKPFDEGSQLIRELVHAGLPRLLYVQMNAVGYIMREVTKTIVGAHCFYSNGSMLSRVGTAMLCHLSRRANVPVVACCQSVKFSDRVQVDAFVHNDKGSPEGLVSQPLKDDDDPNLPLAGWQGIPNIQLVNVLYDLTPPELISMIITEVGIVPTTSVPVILREYNPSSSAAI